MSEGEAVSGIDYNVLANAMDEMREVLRSMVAGLMTDGFTKREAHAIVAKMMGYPPEEEEEA